MVDDLKLPKAIITAKDSSEEKEDVTRKRM